jgi:AcrR family transcriptional regulator
MPKVSDDHRVQRRDQIAIAAMTCFARKGFEGTSMADIIAESGLSAGSIYLHYANKNDLVTHVVADVLSARNAELAEIVVLNPLPHPAEVVRTFVDGLSRVPGGSAMVVQVWAIAARDASLGRLIVDFVGELRGLYGRFLARWLEQSGLPAPQAEHRSYELVPVVLGICQGYILQSAVMPDFDGARFIESVGLIDFASLESRLPAR